MDSWICISAISSGGKNLTSVDSLLTEKANLGLITPESPAHVPIQAHLRAIETEIAVRAGVMP
jgi:hypothetical protein